MLAAIRGTVFGWPHSQKAWAWSLPAPQSSVLHLRVLVPTSAQQCTWCYPAAFCPTGQRPVIPPSFVPPPPQPAPLLPLTLPRPLRCPAPLRLEAAKVAPVLRRQWHSPLHKHCSPSNGVLPQLPTALTPPASSRGSGARPPAAQAAGWPRSPLTRVRYTSPQRAQAPAWIGSPPAKGVRPRPRVTPRVGRLRAGVCSGRAGPSGPRAAPVASGGTSST